MKMDEEILKQWEKNKDTKAEWKHYFQEHREPARKEQ